MFDEVRFKYPLPLDGANDHVYQTKDLVCFLDQYEVREDGTLWHEDYDVEDRSDPNAEGIMRLCGMLTHVNKRWEPMSWTGEMICYDFNHEPQQGWIEWKVTFVDGKVHRCELLEHRIGEATSADAVDPQAEDSSEGPRA